ncbi:MAG: DUF3223 domain-containing protein [Acetobacteraceae bacterium]|nr:DUF3223 domain-containing protein [Acetobacteraceae bacterium]
MSRRERVVLGGKVFSAKSKAEEYVRQIKDAHKPGDFLTGGEAAVVLDALQRHPGCAEKVGLGVQRVGIYGNGETRSGHGFGVERVDGTVTRFSYHICFAAQRRNHVDRAYEAFRQAVRRAILKWRNNTFNKHGGQIYCPIMGTRVDPKCCHVDHLPPSFADLVTAFLATEGLTIDNVAVEISHGEQVEAVLSDPKLRLRWIRFHNQNVKLRIMSIEGHRILHGHIGSDE